MKAHRVRTRRRPPKMARTEAMSVDPGGWLPLPLSSSLLLFSISPTTSFSCSDRRVWFQKGTAVSLPLSGSILDSSKVVFLAGHELVSHTFSYSCIKFSAVVAHNLLGTNNKVLQPLLSKRTKLCVFSPSLDKQSSFVASARVKLHPRTGCDSTAGLPRLSLLSFDRSSNILLVNWEMWFFRTKEI